MSLTGLEKLHPPWSTSEVANAARVLAVEAAQGSLYESASAGTSSSEFVQFDPRMHWSRETSEMSWPPPQPHSHWSRDTGSETSWPPPPPDFTWGSRRPSNASGSTTAVSQVIQHGAAIDQGMRKWSVPEGVPEEVPIGHHGMQRPVRQRLLRSVPENRVTSADSPNRHQTAPWLHGRMWLPPPSGVEGDEARSALYPALGARSASPRPPPIQLRSPSVGNTPNIGNTPRTGADSLAGLSPRVEDNFMTWQDTENSYNVPICPPDQTPRSSFYETLTPWRHSRQQADEEEQAAPLRENDLNATIWGQAEQWQPEHDPRPSQWVVDSHRQPEPFREDQWESEQQAIPELTAPGREHGAGAWSREHEEHWQSQQHVPAEEFVPSHIAGTQELEEQLSVFQEEKQERPHHIEIFPPAPLQEATDMQPPPIFPPPAFIPDQLELPSQSSPPQLRGTLRSRTSRIASALRALGKARVAAVAFKNKASLASIQEIAMDERENHAPTRKRSWRSSWRGSRQHGEGAGKRGNRNSLKSVESVNTNASMFTGHLDPQWKELVKHCNSFKASTLPEVSGGEYTGRSSIAGERPLKLGDCVSAFCRTIYEMDAPVLIPTCALILSLVFTVGLAAVLWSAEIPEVSEGAFALITQTNRGDPVNYSYFEKVREHAIASLTTIDQEELSERGNVLTLEQPNENETIIDYVNNTWAWRHVEVIYTRTGGGLLSEVDQMRSIERKMRRLDGWISLCESVPAEFQFYCNPGDSFAAVLFGSDKPADPVTAASGALSQVVFDGESYNMIMPLGQFVQFLKEFQENFLKRWFADTGPKLFDSPVRSMFAFYLCSENFTAWDTFVNSELKPLLHEVATTGDGIYGDGTSSIEEESLIRVFYRADGLVSNEFVEAVAEDAPWRAVAPLGVLLAVLLTSRRLILACTAASLSVTAPLTSSTLAAGRGPTGILEYPATTVAAWSVVAVSCCELALATANAWAMEHSTAMLPRRLKSALDQCWPGWQFLYRALCFLVEVPAPTVGPACALLVLGFVVDLPLVSEFTLHTSLGLIVTCFFSVLLFPPACELGNQIAERAKHSPIMEQIRKRSYVPLPYECGGEPLFLDKSEVLAGHLVEALSSKTVRAFAFVVALAVAIGACFQETSPQFVSDTPELFHEGHRMRVAPKARSLFGSGELLAGTGAPEPTFRSARKCTPDCHDALDCSWYKCERDDFKEINEGTCACHKQIVGEASAIRGCGAVARFANLPPGSDAFAKVTFWRWAEEKLGELIVNTTVSAFNMGALEMESWATGLVTTATQLVVKTHGSDGQAPAWEDACLRVLCYCGSAQCLLDVGSWSNFGDVEIRTPDRRLEMPSQPSFSTFGRRPNNTVEINMVFGLQGPTGGIPRRYVQPNMVFGRFEIHSPWVQRNVWSYCASIAPQLNINERRCWIEDFRSWLGGNGERFPLPARDFYHRFHAFLTHATYLKSLQQGPSYDYFWLDSTGKIQGCYAVLNGLYDEETGLEKYKLTWEVYMARRHNRSVPETGQPWIASPQFNKYSAEKAVKDAAKNVVALSFISVTLVTLILTCSLGLTIAIVLIEAVTLGILLGIGVGLGRRDFGAIEVCVLAIFMSGLISPLVRVAHQYTLARNALGDLPVEHADAPEDKDDGGFRLRSASSGKEVLVGIQPDSAETPPTSRSNSKQPAESGEELYLVDNSEFKARTIGLGYRLTPHLKNVDKESRGLLGIAQWGTMVAGVPHNQDWIRVGERFLPLKLNECQVLVWQEPQKPSSRVFTSETSAPSGESACVQELKAFFDNVQRVCRLGWNGGATFEERRRRSLTAVKRSCQTVIGASIAGFLAGCGLVPMNMEALGSIGLAVSCAAVTAPTAALGLLPMLAMVRFVGPSRACEAACVC